MERRELETVIYEKDGPVARIILNRPAKANAQNSAMVWDVENSLKDAEADYAIKVVVMKANGPGFCSGHDVASALTFPEFVQAREAGHPWGGSDTLFLWPVLHLWEFPKPTVAAVHGLCGPNLRLSRQWPGSGTASTKQARTAPRPWAERKDTHEARSDGGVLRRHR